MGQSNSLEAGGDRMSEEFDFLHDQIRKHSLTLRQLTMLTYDDLHNKIAELNALSSKYVDCNGKQLLFEVKPGSDSHTLWKAKVRINCQKLDPHTQKIEKSRELYLKQFLQVYNTIVSMQTNLKLTTNPDHNSVFDDSDPKKDVQATSSKMFSPMNASMILDESTSKSSDSLDECCICMESRSEVSLPCTHSYCLACIEQWNTLKQSCPICRQQLSSVDETWCFADLPDAQEVHDSIKKSFFDLTR